jgi:hypothetical protein
LIGADEDHAPFLGERVNAVPTIRLAVTVMVGRIVGEYGVPGCERLREDFRQRGTFPKNVEMGSRAHLEYRTATAQAAIYRAKMRP